MPDVLVTWSGSTRSDRWQESKTSHVSSARAMDDILIVTMRALLMLSPLAFGAFTPLALADPITCDDSLINITCVSGLGTTTVSASLAVQASAQPDAPFDRVHEMVEIDAYTDGPIRPGYLLFNYSCESDEDLNAAGNVNLAISQSGVGGGCLGNISVSVTNEFIPISLGSPLIITLSGQAFATSLSGSELSGGAAEKATFQAIDPSVCPLGPAGPLSACERVDILPVPEIPTFLLKLLGFGLMAGRYRI